MAETDQGDPGALPPWVGVKYAGKDYSIDYVDGWMALPAFGALVAGFQERPEFERLDDSRVRFTFDGLVRVSVHVGLPLPDASLAHRWCLEGVGTVRHHFTGSSFCDVVRVFEWDELRVLGSLVGAFTEIVVDGANTFVILERVA